MFLMRMATLAFVAEEHACAFDIIHYGEDLWFLHDGHVFVTQFFVLEALHNCTPFQSFQIISHGKVCNIENSEIIKNYLSEERVDIHDGRFVNYNNTFLDVNHPSNKGFEGRDFGCSGRRVSFDDYTNIYVPSNDEFQISLTDNYSNHSIIRFEFNTPISPSQKVCIRLGYLIEPIGGKKNRFFLYPPELSHYFHFYTNQSIGTEAMSYLDELNQQNRIMDIRLFSPQRKISTCDFFFMTKNEFIEDLSAPSKQTRIPFSKKNFTDGEYLSYHIYPKDMSNLVPVTKEVTYNGNKINQAVLKFNNNTPLLLKIFRTDKAIFYSAIPTLLGIFATTTAINTQYTVGLQMSSIILISVALTILLLVVMNKIFAKTKIT
jgi:hypothetical protein